MVVNGRVHIDNWAFPHLSPGVNAFENGDKDFPVQDRIGFRRVRFGVKGDVWKNMLYKIEMEFAGGNWSEFRDAYLGFKDLPVLQRVLIGNQKRPYGLDHLNSSRYNVFMERPVRHRGIQPGFSSVRNCGLFLFGRSSLELALRSLQPAFDSG